MPFTIEDLKKRAQGWTQKATEVRTPQFLKPLAGEYLLRREPEKAMAFPVGEGLRPIEKIRAEAKIRELPIRPIGTKEIAVETIKGLPEATKKVLGGVGKFGLDVLLRAPARAAGALTLGIEEEITGRPTKMIPTTPLERFFLGEEELKSVQERAREIERTLERLGVPRDATLPLAGIAVGGLTFLDLAPFGGTKKGLTQQLLKTKTTEEAFSILKKAGVADDLAKDYAPIFAKETTLKGVQKGLRGLESLLKMTRPVEKVGIKAVRPISKITPEAPKIKPEVLPKLEIPKISEEIISSIEEFKKIPIGAKITEPEKAFKIGNISKEISSEIKIPQKVEITRRALKHIIERRGEMADELIKSIPEIITFPSKIAKAKIEDGFLFAKMDGKARGTVLQVIKKPDRNQVVSVFRISNREFEKLVDISGRPAVPPSFRPTEAERLAASRISALQKPTEVIVAKPKEVVKRIPKVIKPAVKKEIEKIGSQMEQARLKGFLQTVRGADRTTTELKTALGEIDPYYKPLTNRGELQAAEMMIKKDFEAAKRMVLDPNVPVGGRKSAMAIQLAKHYESIGDYDEALNIINAYDQQLRGAGQFIQAASLWNKLTPRAILRAGERVGEKYRMVFSDDAKKIVLRGWEKIQVMPEGPERDKATLEVMNFIAEQFPPKRREIFDAFRYQNMLSSPRSHERNIWGNLLQAFIVRPLDLIGEWTYDIIRHPFNPAARDIKLADIKKHYQAVFKTIPEAIGAFKEGIRSGAISEKILETGLKREAESIIEAFRRERLPRMVTMSLRFMEAQDRFFSTLIGAGEKARLMQKGIAEEIAEIQAKTLAEKYLFRERLGMTAKDKVFFVKALDSLGNLILKGRDLPGIGGLLSWCVPFVRTPINIAKFGVERSPLGFIGGTYQREQIGKALIGSIITGMGATLAMQDRTTWLPPIDPEAKRLFYDSGKKPMSVLIGDTWVPMYYLGPFVISLALPAAVKYYTTETKEALTENDIDRIIKIAFGINRIITEMTPVQSISAVIKSLEGDIDYSFPGTTARIVGQAIPFAALLSYINTILDPVYRKSKTFTENLKKIIPVMTKDLPYYEKITGEPAVRNWSDWFLPYSLGMRKEEFERLFKERILEMQIGYKEREILRKAGITEIKTKAPKAMTPSEWRKQMRKK